MNFPFFRQQGPNDCGLACLKMVSKFYEMENDLESYRGKAKGISMFHLSSAAEQAGFKASNVRTDIESLKILAKQIPIILHWNENHFVVLYGFSKSFLSKPTFNIADPAKGLITVDQKTLLSHWRANSSESEEGVALILEPMPSSFGYGKKKSSDELGLSYLIHYLKPYKRFFFQLLLGLLISSCITLATPLLAQSLIDKGVNLKDLSVVNLILAGQLIMFVTSMMIEIVRAKILLKIGSRVNIGMVSDFISKLFQLPISFFDRQSTGELMQRISDHKRIENILTFTSLNTIFSLLNVIVLIILLGNYQLKILTIFLLGTGVGLLWTYGFLPWRKRMDHRFFEMTSNENGKMLEMLDSVVDLKLLNGANQKRTEWLRLQGLIYKLKLTSLNVAQLQSLGGNLLSQLTNIFISFVTASLVIDGSISLGAMFAVNMIVGQLNGPVHQLFNFINTVQTARIGMNRIGEVALTKNETNSNLPLVTDISEVADIILKDVSFNYSIERSDSILKNVNLTIPNGKVTAVVGTSGGGKTTLLKMLLRFYDPSKGVLSLGNTNFKNLDHMAWRNICGVVMQDGKLFKGSVVDNITLGQEIVMSEVVLAAKIAGLEHVIESLPLSYLTEIGTSSCQLSAGEKQRFLIARAVYKKPAYLFLDEATSALDSSSEKTVLENLKLFFAGRTVVVIAHRLSTIRGADQIVVMSQGAVVEVGDHAMLLSMQGKYHELIKNQMSST